MENFITNTNSSDIASAVNPSDSQPSPGINQSSKPEKRPLSTRDKILYGLAVLSILSANVAVYVGLLLPPEGEIHGSILMFFGLVCAFSAAMFGITADFHSSLISLRTDPPSSPKQ